MFLFLCAAIPCGTDCRSPRFQTNDLSFLSYQSSGLAQTREETSSVSPSLIKFVVPGKVLDRAPFLCYIRIQVECPLSKRFDLRCQVW